VTTETYDPTDLGPIAAALAKAQSQFPTITRDKTVTVTTKAGGSYSFKYAPLDSILAAVRKPLSDNGLALVQLLDHESLVTMLIHESGASLSGRTALIQTSDIQALGSAITYLRRYAIQALLGIAAEEDDDGNRAAGNTVKANVAPSADGSLIGVVDVKAEWLKDLELRQTPEGPVIGFQLKQGRKVQSVQAHGALAEQLAAIPALPGVIVTCWGDLVGEEFTPRGMTRPVAYQVLRLNRIHGPTFDLPATHATPPPDAPQEPSGGPTEAPSYAAGSGAAPELTEAESEAIWAEVDRIGA
jgi:hypothetical protein